MQKCYKTKTTKHNTQQNRLLGHFCTCERRVTLNMKCKFEHNAACTWHLIHVGAQKHAGFLSVFHIKTLSSHQFISNKTNVMSMYLNVKPETNQ